MFRVAAHPLCAVTPARPARPPRAGPPTNNDPPEWESRGLCSPLARVWGEEPQPFPQAPRAFSMPGGAQLNRVPGVGTGHHLDVPTIPVVSCTQEART